jgi:hypothetical protein
VSDAVDWTESTFEGNRMRQHKEFRRIPKGAGKARFRPKWT